MKDLIIENNKGTAVAKYTADMVKTIKDTVAKNATDSELKMFLTIASMYDLNPFKKEIWFTKFKGQTTIMTSRDGYVKIAKQKPGFMKIQSNAVYAEDEFSMEWEGMDIKSIHHKHAAKDRGNIVGAWAGIRSRTDGDIYVYVPFKEYAKDNQFWRYGSAMIRKVAEKEVCRLYADVSGLHIPEEMPRDFDLETSQKRIVKKDCAEPDQPETVEKPDDVIEAEIIQPEEVVEEDFDEEELTDYLNEIDEKTELSGREEAIAATETITEEYFEEIIQNYCEKLYENQKPITKGRIVFYIDKSNLSYKDKKRFKEYLRDNWREEE